MWKVVIKGTQLSFYFIFAALQWFNFSLRTSDVEVYSGVTSPFGVVKGDEKHTSDHTLD